MHFLRLFFATLLLFTLVNGAWAQEEPQRRRGSRIIDDTTKQVYGPTTSRYYYERDVFFDRTTYYPIDTLIRNFHRYTYVQRHENLYQDLGNIGTAMHPIYYQTPQQIGARSGFEAYDPYWDAEEIRHYDTKSPYSNMRVILGGKGRSVTRATYSRNINPRWNFGFNYRGLFIDKQIQRQGKGDRHTRSNYYDFHTTFQTKDSTYRVFFNFRRNRHEVDEYGGIQTDDDFIFEDYFFVNAQPQLTQASSIELRTNLHLFHQYEVGRALHLYHKLDRYRQGNDFKDRPKQAPKGFYDATIPMLRSDTTFDRTTFRTLRNEVGIKGNLLKLFYNGYYAIRDYSIDYKYFPSDSLQVKTSAVESYIGGRMSLKLDSLVEVTAWAEVMNTGNYRIDGQIISKWFDASARQLQYAPSFIHQAYRGAHDEWNNNFSNVNVTQFSGNIHYRSRVLTVSPGLTFTRLGNYVFFKYQQDTAANSQQVLPRQSSGQQVIASPQLRVSLTMLKHIHLRSHVIYTQVLDNPEEAIQIPELFVNSQLSWENIFFNGNLDMQLGVDVHWRSDYYANAYDVPTQQFFVQKYFKTPSFPLVDVFFNAKIKRGRIFIKYHNVLQMITKEGYLLTPGYPNQQNMIPGYPAQRNIIDFGFDWSFYD